MDLSSKSAQVAGPRLGELFKSKRSSLNDTTLRTHLAARLDLVSRLSLGIMVILTPFRSRLVILSVPIPPIYGDYTNLQIFASDFFLLAVLLFWGLSLAFHPRAIRVTPVWLTVPITALALAGIISIPGSADPLLSLYQAAHLVLLVGLYLYVLNQVVSLRLVTITAGVQLAIQAAVGIAQVLGQHSLGLSNLQELQLDPAWKGVSIITAGASHTLRAYGLTDHPNILGGCLALCLIFLIAAYVKSNDGWKPILGGLTVLGVIGLFLTFSRSAWLGFAGGSILLLAWLIRERSRQGLKHLAALAAACLIVISPFLWADLPYLETRADANGSFAAPTPENQAIGERILLINQSATIFAVHPWTGVGVGAFPIALKHAQPSYPFAYQPPHVVLLDVAAETGLLGGLAYLLLILSPLVFLVRRVMHGAVSFELAAVSAALLGLTVISFFDYYPWMLEPGRLWLWLLWGLFAGVWGNQPQRSTHA